MKNVVYIHGANSSSTSFRYLQSSLPHKSILNLEYSVNTPFVENEVLFKQALEEEFKGEEFMIVGHSMGGLFAARLINEFDNAVGAITISAPYGGSKFVDYLRWVYPASFRYQLFNDIKPSSDIIKGFKTYETEKTIKQLVTSRGGNPLLGEANDGTVTVTSQMAISNVEFIPVDLNHFEVLLSDITVNNIEMFMESH